MSDHDARLVLELCHPINNCLSQTLSSIPSLHGLQEGPYGSYTSCTRSYCGHFQPHIYTHPKSPEKSWLTVGCKHHRLLEQQQSQQCANTSKGTQVSIRISMVIQSGEKRSSPREILWPISTSEVHKYTLWPYSLQGISIWVVIQVFKMTKLVWWFSDIPRSLTMDRSIVLPLYIFYLLRVGSPFNGKLWRRGSVLIVSCDVVVCRQTCLKRGWPEGYLAPGQWTTSHCWAVLHQMVMIFWGLNIMTWGKGFQVPLFLIQLYWVLTYDRGGPAVSCRWTSRVWEIR